MTHQVDKKKARGTLSWKTRLILAGAAAAAAVTAAILLTPKENISPEVRIPAAERATVLSEKSLADITSVTVTPDDGEAYTLLSDGTALSLAGHADYTLRDSITQAVIDNICHVQAERVILDTADMPVDLGDFGLSPEVFSARIDYTDGTSDLIRVGNQIQGDAIPYYYFMWNSDSRIFAGGTDMAAAFNTEFTSLRYVDPLHVRTDILERIEIRGEEDLVLEYTDFGWQITSPFTYPASGKKMEGYLKNMESLRFSRWLYPADTCDLNALGLDENALTVTLTEGKSVLTVPDADGKNHRFDVPEREIRIRIGAPYDNTSYYAEYDGEIYTIGLLAYQILTRNTAQDFRQLNPFQLELYQLDRILIESAGAKTEYSLRFEETESNASTDTTGEDISYILHVSRNGEEMDTQDFQRWYQYALYDFLPEGSLREAVPADAEPVITVTLENAYAKRTVELVPCDSLHAAIRVDGSAFDYVSLTTASRIIDPSLTE